jgi:hypothetical protein
MRGAGFPFVGNLELAFELVLPREIVLIGAMVAHGVGTFT